MVFAPVRQGLDRRRALGTTRVRAVMGRLLLAPGDLPYRASSAELRFVDCRRRVEDIVFVPFRTYHGVVYRSIHCGDGFAFGHLLSTYHQ